MRAVHHLDLPEEKDGDAGAFPFRDLGPQFEQERRDIEPADSGRRWAGKDQRQGPLISGLHLMILENSTY